MKFTLSGGYAEDLGLRGYDAVHLATALDLGDEEVVVVTWDRDLAKAVEKVGVGIAGFGGDPVLAKGIVDRAALVISWFVVGVDFRRSPIAVAHPLLQATRWDALRRQPKVWRRSWKRISRTPAFLSERLKRATSLE